MNLKCKSRNKNKMLKRATMPLKITPKSSRLSKNKKKNCYQKVDQRKTQKKTGQFNLIKEKKLPFRKKNKSNKKT